MYNVVKCDKNGMTGEMYLILPLFVWFLKLQFCSVIINMRNDDLVPPPKI